MNKILLAFYSIFCLFAKVYGAVDNARLPSVKEMIAKRNAIKGTSANDQATNKSGAVEKNNQNPPQLKSREMDRILENQNKSGSKRLELKSKEKDEKAIGSVAAKNNEKNSLQEFTKRELDSVAKFTDEKINSSVAHATEKINSSAAKVTNKINSGLNKAAIKIDSGLNTTAKRINEATEEIDSSINKAAAKIDSGLNRAAKKIDQVTDEIDSGINRAAETIDKATEKIDSGLNRVAERIDHKVNEVKGRAVEQAQKVNKGVDIFARNLKRTVGSLADRFNNSVDRMSGAVDEAVTGKDENPDIKFIERSKIELDKKRELEEKSQNNRQVVENEKKPTPVKNTLKYFGGLFKNSRK